MQAAMGLKYLLPNIQVVIVYLKDSLQGYQDIRFDCKPCCLLAQTGDVDLREDCTTTVSRVFAKVHKEKERKRNSRAS